METTHCGKWRAEEKAKQCSAPTDGGEMVLVDAEQSSGRRGGGGAFDTGSFTMSAGNRGGDSYRRLLTKRHWSTDLNPVYGKIVAQKPTSSDGIPPQKEKAD